MKALLILTATLLTALATTARAGTNFFKVTLTGTVQTQTLLSPTDGRIHTEILNEKRILTEFQVSKADYELVFDTDTFAVLLVPKHTSAGLPTITVVATGNGSNAVVDTKARVIHYVNNADAGTATNLFKNVDGEFSGTVRYVGPIQSAVLSKAVLSFNGHGTNNGGSGGSSALLKFKLVSTGRFTPAS